MHKVSWVELASCCRYCIHLPVNLAHHTLVDNLPRNADVYQTAVLHKALAAVVGKCPVALVWKHSMDGNYQGAFHHYIDNLGMDDLIHSYKSLVHGEGRRRG